MNGKCCWCKSDVRVGALCDACLPFSHADGSELGAFLRLLHAEDDARHIIAARRDYHEAGEVLARGVIAFLRVRRTDYWLRQGRTWDDRDRIAREGCHDTDASKAEPNADCAAAATTAAPANE